MSDFLHLWQALVMGCGLGVVYDFLQPLRPRWFSDLLLVWALFASWIRLVFGLCGGDLRFAYTGCLLLGMGLWHSAFGQWLQPVFTVFWNGLYRFFCLVFLPFKKLWEKLRKIRNFLFASGKKWVTIKCNKHPPGTGIDD